MAEREPEPPPPPDEAGATPGGDDEPAGSDDAYEPLEVTTLSEGNHDD